MRHRPSLRSIALTAAATAALAAATAGCGGDGESAGSVTGAAAATTGPATPDPATPDPATPDPTATAPTKTAPSASPASAARLRATAAAHAGRVLGIRNATPANVTLLRSRRDPSWAIASGAEGRTLWVVWLRDGVGAIATKDPARFNPGGVPCDVRPAFSEPGC